jgi:hypothetical protein
MKPERKTAEPTAMERLANEMCALFWERDWTPSMANFQPRPFVEWHGAFFSAAGTTPSGRTCSIACRTAEEVIAFLESASAVPVETPAPVVEPEPEPVSYNSGKIAEPEPVAIEAAPDPRDAELAALRAELAELKARDRSAFSEAPLLPAPDALMSDYGPVGEGYDDVTGDMLLDAFEQDEAEAVAVIQVLSATRQRHLSEQLNVEKARLRREHMLTDQANPREASIDRLLGLLTRRGD